MLLIPNPYRVLARHSGSVGRQQRRGAAINKDTQKLSLELGLVSTQRELHLLLFSLYHKDSKIKDFPPWQSHDAPFKRSNLLRLPHNDSLAGYQFIDEYAAVLI